MERFQKVASSSLTFGNEGAVPAKGGVFAGGGVAPKQGLRFIREEALCPVHRRLLRAHAAGPTHAAATTTAAAAGRVKRLVDGTEALGYIHWGHQLVDVKLQAETERWKRKDPLISSFKKIAPR